MMTSHPPFHAARTAVRRAAIAALLAWAAPARGQASQAGFVSEPNTGTDIVYVAHQFRTGADVTTARLDAWSEGGWGVAGGAGYFAEGGSHGWSVDGVVMRRLRKHQNSLSQPGVQLQAGISLAHADGDWAWQAPVALGVIVHAEPGPIAGHPWLAPMVVVRGGNGDTEVGAGASVGVRAYMNAPPLSAWGAMVSFNALRISDRTETGLEISILRVL
ncbi:MAG TPA: hypothetical protein VJT67_01655 [Longimicrobiaceae bacterium]|nr:hypothetical protein [Longimicrobiaceae bacterium]